MSNRQPNWQTEAWKLYFDDTAFPNYLLVKATGMLDETFYVQLFADLRAYMAATLGLHAPFAPVIVDARDCFPNRQGINTLRRLVSRINCHSSPFILWINQQGANGSIQYSVALMLRATFKNVHIVTHLDEAFWLLGITPSPQQSVHPSLLARIVRWSL